MDLDSFSAASQWQLVWWRFRRNKLAMVGLFVIAWIYLMAAFADFIAPHDPTQPHRTHQYAPPQLPRFIDAEGRFHLRPFVYKMTRTFDSATMRPTWTFDTSERYSIRLFVRVPEYRLWGVIPIRTRLFGTDRGEWFPLGTDRLGRDLLSRAIHAARVSTTVGLLGVTISLLLGVIIGGVSGYYGGTVDAVIQRAIEFLMGIPKIPLWMGLSAALPVWWSPVSVYFAITLILSLIGWTGLAREVRGRFLALRDEDFVTAARLANATEARIIFRHLLPSMWSHVIASASLAIPNMILGETSLSYLGIGLRPPAISWGVLMQEAQNIQSVALYPWLLIPGIFVIVTVLAFNFVGDGLRDAADPYVNV